MYLMLQDVPVLRFDITEQIYEVLDEDRMPIRLRNVFAEKNPSDIPTAMKYYEALTDFFSHRIMNLDRRNAKKILNAYHFPQSQDPLTKTKIAIACKAISVTDDYWLNDDNLSFKWENINPRKNRLNEIVSHIALVGSSLTLTGMPHTPELTGQGAYAKAWIREPDGLYLYKMGTGELNEQRTEIMTSRILDCFDIPHVTYKTGYFEGHEVSKCLNMCNDDYSIVTAEDYYSYCCRNEKDFQKEVLNIDSDMFYKTCIVDYLISNSDRHMENWGFYMENKTGKVTSIHPLFDHNNAFDKGDMESPEGGDSLMLLGKTKKQAALYAIKKCHLRCIKPVTQDMFMNEKQYQSFMKRAVELGLYHAPKKTFLEKFKKTEKYVPVKLEKPEERKSKEKVLESFPEPEPEPVTKQENKLLRQVLDGKYEIKNTLLKEEEKDLER